MTNRRDFLRTTGAMALGGMLLPDLMKGASLHEFKPIAGIGIQTFTLNSFMGNDPKATFKRLAEIGYKNIETATFGEETYYTFKPKEFKKIMDDLGMKWIGHHAMGAPLSETFSLPANPTPEQKAQYERIQQMASQMKAPNLRENLQKLVDDAAEGGLEFLVCANTPISSLDKIKKSIDTFNKAGEACKKAGLQFAYHNHATEWDPVEGTTAYDAILSQTDKNLVKMELDLGWVATAKKDVVELFKGNPGRFPLFHMKDFVLATNTMTPVGEGNVDFKRAFDNAKLAGMKYYFIEQDTAKSMDDVILAYNNTKKLLNIK
jgi:sugar phosphate isomerase/epimerase